MLSTQPGCAVAQRVCIPQHFPRSRGAGISSAYGFNKQLEQAGFQSQSALLKKLFRLTHTPILCPLPTKGSTAEHFGRLSYCFSVKLCFGVCHYQSTELCRQQKFLLHNGVESDHVTRKHSKHKRSTKKNKTILIPWTREQ